MILEVIKKMTWLGSFFYNGGIKKYGDPKHGVT